VRDIAEGTSEAEPIRYRRRRKSPLMPIPNPLPMRAAKPLFCCRPHLHSPPQAEVALHQRIMRHSYWVSVFFNNRLPNWAIMVRNARKMFRCDRRKTIGQGRRTPGPTSERHPMALNRKALSRRPESSHDNQVRACQSHQNDHLPKLAFLKCLSRAFLWTALACSKDNHLPGVPSPHGPLLSKGNLVPMFAQHPILVG
jgi:hypothetical protein